jgi:hypothetical protein
MDWHLAYRGEAYLRQPELLLAFVVLVASALLFPLDFEEAAAEEQEPVASAMDPGSSEAPIPFCLPLP